MLFNQLQKHQLSGGLFTKDLFDMVESDDACETVELELVKC